MENLNLYSRTRLEILIQKINVALLLNKEIDMTFSIRFKTGSSTELKKSSIRSFRNNVLELEDNSLIEIYNIVDLTYCN